MGGVRTGLEPQGAFLLRWRSWLNPASALALMMALWRLGYDLDWTGRFAISGGIFSHWQVWMALALVLRVVQVRTGLAQ